MALPKIKVNLEQKTFSIDDTEVKLEDNFIGAELFNIEGNPKEPALQLIYLTKETFNSDKEAEKIYLLAKGKKLLKQLEVNSFPVQEYLENHSFPAVVVYGKMDATLSNR